MTPTRAAALEAVAEALYLAQGGKFPWAQLVQMAKDHPDCIGAKVVSQTRQESAAALDALSSLPAEPEPEGEMVEVRAGVYKNGPNIYSVMGMRFEDGQIVVTESDNLIATITARIPRPVVPEVVAEVVKP